MKKPSNKWYSFENIVVMLGSLLFEIPVLNILFIIIVTVAIVIIAPTSACLRRFFGAR